MNKYWHYLSRTTAVVLILNCSTNTVNAADMASAKRHLVTGSLTMEHVAALDAALKANPDLNEIELVDVPGARKIAPDVAYQFQLRINRNQIRTYARSFCASTCAYIFLMGHERTLLPSSTGQDTLLLLHSIHSGIDGTFQRVYNDDLISIVHQRSEGRLPLDLLNKMYDTTDRSGGIYIYRKPGSTGGHIFFQAQYGAKRLKISDATPADLGINIDE
ncbi:hypothetical protein DFR42_1163 [Undibacterium pigrum]|uniref:Uncharacterized protein n=2 Tax=Undibacterium pigrum TaxID=401470 RepID=A0A318IPB1_9BURK|nr:hypothetical protein DFR42_1163 [Undibacterium pigrum]